MTVRLLTSHAALALAIAVMAVPALAAPPVGSPVAPPIAPPSPAPVAAASAVSDGVSRAVALRQSGQFLEATQVLLVWLGDHPADARARNELGTLYALHGQLREAQDQFEQAVQLQPKLRAARWNLAEAQRADERCNDALPHYAKLVEDDPRDGPPYKGLCLCNAILGRWDAAVAACDALAKKFPGTSLGKWAEAQRSRISELAAAGELTVGQMEAEGKQLFAEKRYADAAVWLAMAAVAEPSADREYRLAMALLGIQDLLACHAALERAVRLDPKHQPALVAMVTVARALRNFGSGARDIRFGAIDETIERALARALIDADLVVARQLAVVITAAKAPNEAGAIGWLLAAEVELRDGRYSKALEWLDKANKARPRHDAIRKAQAEVYFQLGRFADARQLASLPSPPAHVATHADLAVFIRHRRDEFVHQLKMMLDPGLRPLPAIQDLVAGDMRPPPKVETVPVEVAPTVPTKPTGKAGKPGKKK